MKGFPGMRTTVIDRLDAERFEAYDPDFHDLLTREMELDVLFEEASEDTLEIQFDLMIAFVDSNDRKIGRISLEAVSTLEALDEIPINDEGEVIVEELSENVLRLIEGGLAEDALLPASQLSRSMHLPSILPIPRLFKRTKAKE